MPVHRLKLDPNICPACRSVQTSELSVISDTERVCQCRSCQKKYTQTFYPGANMRIDSPIYITDERNVTIWSSSPKRYDANGHEIK